jgi:hypothetical protein
MRTPGVDGYLRALAARMSGSRRARARLLRELADHLEDATAAKVALGLPPVEAEREALAQIGDADTIAEQWRSRTQRVQRRQGTRIALAAATVALASVLGITSAASGHRNPSTPAPRRRAPPPRPRASEHRLPRPRTRSATRR